MEEFIYIDFKYIHTFTTNIWKTQNEMKTILILYPSIVIIINDFFGLEKLV